VVDRSGRLARTLVEEAGWLGVAVRANGRPDLDITKPDLVQRVGALIASRAIKARRSPDLWRIDLGCGGCHEWLAEQTPC
jgi:hypothetical protein